MERQAFLQPPLLLRLSLLHVYLEIGLGLNPELGDRFSQRIRSADMLLFMKAVNPVAEKGVFTSG